MSRCKSKSPSGMQCMKTKGHKGFHETKYKINPEIKTKERLLWKEQT